MVTKVGLSKQVIFEGMSENDIREPGFWFTLDRCMGPEPESYNLTREEQMQFNDGVKNLVHKHLDTQIAQHKKILTRIKTANRMDAYVRVLSCSYRTPPQPDEEPDHYFERLAHIVGPGIDVKAIIEDMTIGSLLDEIIEIVENRDKTNRILVVDHAPLYNPREKTTMYLHARDSFEYPVEPMTGQQKRRQRRKSKKKS